jgi:hypothetical protein
MKPSDVRDSPSRPNSTFHAVPHAFNCMPNLGLTLWRAGSLVAFLEIIKVIHITLGFFRRAQSLRQSAATDCALPRPASHPARNRPVDAPGRLTTRLFPPLESPRIHPALFPAPLLTKLTS